MEPRLDYKSASPGAHKAMRALGQYVQASGLEHSLLERVRTRVSQINGCAHCLDMHTKEARAAGETEQRLYLITAWREAPCYTPRERAALAWAEAVTRIAEGEIGEEQYAEVRAQFSEKELVDLTVAIISINGWNRLAVPFRAETGSYRPRAEAIP
ncbi:MAG: carboxymuconolactone decarboxylase family protein [Burkholderiales bacterium]|nr:carboxymuconolactone decarboxylase family protein [Burkholderiales bacterium]